MVDGIIEASVAIINGQDIVPVNFSWAILLTEFIKEVNKLAEIINKKMFNLKVSMNCQTKMNNGLSKIE